MAKDNTKICVVCEKEKSLTEFNKRASETDGRRKECRICQKQANAGYRNTPNGRLRRAFHVAKARAKAAGAYDTLTFEELKETFDAAVDHGCVYCGGELENDWSVEHVIPYSKGGTNEIHNVVIAHNACNFRKHNHAPADYCEAPGSLDQLAAYLYVMSDGKYEIDEAYALLKSGEANGE